MDNTAPNNNDGHHNSHNDSDSTSFDNALIISTSEAVTSVSSTEVESLAARLIKAQEEHMRAEAKGATAAQEGKMEVPRLT